MFLFALGAMSGIFLGVAGMHLYLRGLTHLARYIRRIRRGM